MASSNTFLHECQEKWTVTVSPALEWTTFGEQPTLTVSTAQSSRFTPPATQVMVLPTQVTHMGLSWLLRSGWLKQIKRQLLWTTKTKWHQKSSLGGGGVVGNVHRGVTKACTTHHASPVAHHQYWINLGVKPVHSGPSLTSIIGRTPPKSKNQCQTGTKKHL